MIQKTKGASLFWISIFWILGATFTLVKAQKVDAVAALLKNPDVVWVGEIEAFVPFDAYILWEEEARVKDCINLEKMGAEEFYDTYNFSKYLPNLNTTQKIIQNGAFGGDFTMRLLKRVETKKRGQILPTMKLNVFGRIMQTDFIAKNVLYKDMACTKSQTKTELENLLQSADTVITFDAETLEEIVRVVRNPTQQDIARGYKVRQLVFYNQKMQAFGCKSLAFAPLIERYAENGKLSSSEAWAWVEVEPLAQQVRFEVDASVPWAMGLRHSYDLSKAKVLKQQKKLTECIKEVTSLDFYQKQAALANLAGFYDGNGGLYSEKDLQEQIQIMKQAPSPFDFSPTTHMRFYQEWYFNGSTQKFSAHTTVFAPTYKEEWGTPAIYYKNVAQ